MSIRAMVVVGLTIVFAVGRAGADENERENPRMRIGYWEWISVDSPHPYNGGANGPEVVWSETLENAEALTVRIHFSENTALGESDLVIIRDADGYAVETFRGHQAANRWTRSVIGHLATVEIVAEFDGGGYGVEIDRVGWATHPIIAGPDARGGTGSICDTGVPSRIRTADPIARLSWVDDCGGMYVCTGWLFSPQGHLMTNAHCANSESESASLELWFNYQGYSCDLAGRTNPDIYVGASFESMECDVDVAVHVIDDPVKGNPVDVYGYLPIDRQIPANGSELWIPQHPGGDRKQIAENCHILDNVVGGLNGCHDPPNGCGNDPYPSGMADMSYDCAGLGGSSGSPVLNAEDEVIAIHHASSGSGYPRYGVRMSEVAQYLPNFPIELQIEGPETVDEGQSAQFTAAAIFLLGQAHDVTMYASWSAYPSSAGTIDDQGMFTANQVDADTEVTIRATYIGQDGIILDLMDTLVVDLGGAPLVIVSSDPPDGAIDARQPSDVGGGDPSGWQMIDLTVSGEAYDLTVDDFTVTQEGGDGPPPAVAAVVFIEFDVVRLILSDIIEPGAWTIFTHNDSGSEVRLGFLPADVSGDGTSSTSDILDLIDALNGVGDPLPIWGTDINRSDVAEPSDILSEIDLLNGAGEFDVWNGASLP